VALVILVSLMSVLPQAMATAPRNLDPENPESAEQAEQ
jgi:hypothetical protein